MNFLLFEWMVGGGLIESDCPLDQDDSFLKQGSAMFSALAEDLIAAGHDVVAPLDARICQSEHAAPWAEKRRHFSPVLIQGDLWQCLRDLALEADQIFIIAPESDGILAQCYQHLETFSEKWFGGPVAWIELASDKNRMQEYLGSHGIAVPPSEMESGLKWVAKPTQGAGSDDVQVFSDTNRKTEFQDRKKWRVEQFVPGKSVSISVINAGGNHFFLPPTGQIFDDRGIDSNVGPSGSIGAYVGAEYPLDQHQTQRARALAQQTVDVLPTFNGYIGIDMILADDGPDGVVEINPRMTMSYCHLPEELRRGWLEAPVSTHKKTRLN